MKIIILNSSIIHFAFHSFALYPVWCVETIARWHDAVQIMAMESPTKFQIEYSSIRKHICSTYPSTALHSLDLSIILFHYPSISERTIPELGLL